MSDLNGFNPGSTAGFIASLIRKRRNNLAGLPAHVALIADSGNPKPSLRLQLSPGKASRKKRGK
jgi:hypothetical protein